MGRRRYKNAGGKKIASHGLAEHKATPFKMSAFRPREEAPSAVDLRPFCSPVEDQSQSNSCAANAIVGAYEYLERKVAATKGDEDFGDISRLFVYYVGRLRDKQKYKKATKIGDEGMTLGGAIDAIQMKGACLQATWPFDLAVVNEKPPEEAFTEGMRYKVSDSQEIPCDPVAMKACLASGYPIVFGLKLTKAFFHPGPTGLIKTPDPDDPKSAEHGLHAMLLVGYSDAHQRFIVRNSWGEDWGDGGYCYIPYDYAGSETYNFLGQYAIYGLTDTDFTPDPVPEEDDFIPEEPEEEGSEEDDGGYESYSSDEESEEDDGSDDLDDFFDPLKEARRAFDQFDEDGSGSLSMRELNKALLMNGTFMKKRHLKKLMKKNDRDRDHRIDFDEFCYIPGVLPEELQEDVWDAIEDGSEESDSSEWSWASDDSRGYRGGGYERDDRRDDRRYDRGDDRRDDRSPREMDPDLAGDIDRIRHHHRGGGGGGQM